MSDYIYSDFRAIRPILHANSPSGKRLTLDYRLQRYMIVLYAALHLSIFEQHYKRDGKNYGLTLYSLERVAKNLVYEFDRTRISGKIYADQEKEGRVRKKNTGIKTFYMLTKKGILFCEECIETFLAMGRIQPSAWEVHTEEYVKKLDHVFAKVLKMSEKEQQRWLKKNPGGSSLGFAQPTKEDEKLDLLLQKIKSLS